MLKPALLTVGALAALFSAPTLTDAEARTLADGEVFQIDAAHSSVLFKVTHLSVAPFYGRFNALEGSFRVDSKSPENSMFEVRIPADSIDSNNERRDGHLKSPDFFAAKEHPTITLKSTKVEKKADDVYRVTADLTIRGKTESIEFDAHHSGTAKVNDTFGLRSGYHATFTIDRTKFGVNYAANSKVLSNDVEITVAVEGAKK